MMTVFEIFVNFVEIFITTGFLTLYLGCRHDNKIKYIGFLLGWFAGVAEITLMNYITIFESFGSYIPIVIYFVYAVICLKGNLLLKLWMSIITQIIVTMVAVVTNVAVCCAIDYEPMLVITVFNSIRVWTIIISKIVLVVCYAVILRNKYKNPIQNNLWYKLIIIPLVSVISITTLMKITLQHVDMIEYVFVGMICIVLANVTTYYFFTVISKDYNTRLRVRLLEQQNENALKNIENADAFVAQMRSVRHDIENQLLSIYNFIDLGKIDEAKSYIHHLTDDCLPIRETLITTDNDAFNAIINAKMAVCYDKKIFMHVNVMQGSLSNFDPIDISVLFGNLVDNAIEAAEKTKRRRISIDVYTTGDYLSVSISNSIEKSVLTDNKKLETSKKNKDLHGIGLKSVRTLVKKYNGMINFEEKEQEFICNILIDKTIEKYW